MLLALRIEKEAIGPQGGPVALRSCIEQGNRLLLSVPPQKNHPLSIPMTLVLVQSHLCLTFE